ncbi:hypothetical protein MCG98_11875 [Ruminococcus sp. OA3]|uniref:hypothetical protein n=1 Tax=Ruminococcus sp. OA3 TaxID=2914164 RepID=UPI001F054771|nr:hypothetical protein [Ruminococcus sp. OA3]MCH1983261.1 hypothetical protein [Ruminococcus sp. OA3]
MMKNKIAGGLITLASITAFTAFTAFAAEPSASAAKPDSAVIEDSELKDTEFTESTYTYSTEDGAENDFALDEDVELKTDENGDQYLSMEGGEKVYFSTAEAAE